MCKHQLPSLTLITSLLILSFKWNKYINYLLWSNQENEFIKQRIARGNVRYIWTSGRKCNFAGCDRADLQPANVNGWFWSGSGAKIGPTTQRNSGDWSHTGGYGQQQPDNREAAQVLYTHNQTNTHSHSYTHIYTSCTCDVFRVEYNKKVKSFSILILTAICVLFFLLTLLKFCSIWCTIFLG